VAGVSGCDSRRDQAGYWRAERVRVEVAQALELAQYRFDKRVAAGMGELRVLQEESQSLAVRLKNLREDKELLEAEVEEVARLGEEFSRESASMARTEMVGKSFDSFAAADGREFHEVTVTKVNDLGVDIRHQHGAARLHYSDLSDEHRELFGLDQELAARAERLEREKSLAYGRWIDRQMVAIKQVKREDAERRASKERVSSMRFAAAPVQTRERPLAMSAKPFGTSSRYRRSYRRSSRSTSYRYYYYCPPRNPRNCSSIKRKSTTYLKRVGRIPRGDTSK
jgi:hypothetical protein